MGEGNSCLIKTDKLGWHQPMWLLFLLLFLPRIQLWWVRAAVSKATHKRGLGKKLEEGWVKWAHHSELVRTRLLAMNE